MRLITLRCFSSIALAVLALGAAGCATEAANRPVPAPERYSRSETTDYTVRTRDSVLEDTLTNTLARCKAVQRRYDVPVDCKVTRYKGYPTMLLSFSNARAVKEYSEVVVDELAMPFCDSLTNANVVARLVLHVRDVGMASIYACETGKLSEWVRIA